MRKPINDNEISAIKSLVSLARKMVHGELTYFEGASQVLEFRNIKALENEKLLEAFIVISSETDHLPLESQKHLWSQKALEKLEQEYIKTEEWASIFAKKSCKDIITKYGNS